MIAQQASACVRFYRNGAFPHAMLGWRVDHNGQVDMWDFRTHTVVGGYHNFVTALYFETSTMWQRVYPPELAVSDGL